MAELPISAIFQTPPFWLTSEEALPGNPYDDTVAFLQRIRGLQSLDCFGIKWNIQSAPPGYGLVVNNAENRFDRRMIAVKEILIDSNANLWDGFLHESDQAQGVFTFTTWPLWAINIQLSPGVTADLFWVVVFT